MRKTAAAVWAESMHKTANVEKWRERFCVYFYIFALGDWDEKRVFLRKRRIEARKRRRGNGKGVCTKCGNWRNIDLSRARV